MREPPAVLPGSLTSMGRICAALMLAIWCTSPFAQQRPPDSGRIYQESQKPTLAPPKSGVDVLPKAPEPKPALGAPGLKLVVSGFRITGNTIYPENVLLEQVTEFVGKEQTIDGLNDAATKVRAYYRERGYFLVQAYLPKQEIKGGVVEIAVIEARIGKVAVNIKEGTRYSETIVRGIVEAHLAEGEIITETGLETPLLLLNDLPNASVTSEIKPSQTIGSADLVVNVSDPGPIISGSVDADTFGNRYTGQNRYGVTFNLNNPFALGDQISYRAFRTNHDMAFYRAAYVVPVGYWGTRVGVSYTTFHYKLKEEFEPLNFHGSGTVYSVFGFHPILRTRGANVILAGRLRRHAPGRPRGRRCHPDHHRPQDLHRKVRAGRRFPRRHIRRRPELLQLHVHQRLGGNQPAAGAGRGQGHPADRRAVQQAELRIPPPAENQR